MTDSTRPPYRPIGEEPSGAATLLRHLVPLSLVAFIAAGFLAPDLVRRLLPGHGVDPIAARMVAIVALFLYVAATGIRDSRCLLETRRVAFASFAAAVGGRETERPLRLDGSGWEAKEQVEYEALGRAVVLSASRGKEAAFAFRLATAVALRRDFQMQVLPNGTAMRFVLSKSFLLPVFSMAVKSGGSARVSVRRNALAGASPAATMDPASLVERMRYLAEDPVATGDPEFDRAFLVKASERDAGRGIAADPGFHAALAALAARTRNFQAGVESESPDAPARIVVAATADVSPELFQAMDGVLRATVAALARAGLLDGAARGVA